jgi:multidrug efflux pump subunit AcrA (membrane-fusion protein)
MASQAGEPLRVDGMIVVAIESVDVPATQTGLIDRIHVREGDRVVAGDSIASLDDRDAQINESIAKTQLEVARRRVEGDWQSEIAAAKLEAEKQSAAQATIVASIAKTKASNDVRIQATQKSAEVAKVELDRAIQSRQRYVESVSKSEIDGLRLAHEKSLLEIEQAGVDHDLDRMAALAEAKATVGHQKNLHRYSVELQQARGEQEIAALEANLAAQRLELARLEIQQHRITSPIHGTVAERYKSKGDWITLGQPIVRVIRLDRLRAEGFVGLDQLSSLRLIDSVQVSVRVDPETTVERTGKIVFISPEIDPVNNEIGFWVEFDNVDGVVLPGMRVTVETSP